MAQTGTESGPVEQAAASTGERRGYLKVYMGAAPGGGKTYAMLREGHRLRQQGHDVVIGLVETYNRPRTVEAIGDLEMVPRKGFEYKGTMLEDMDLDAVLARRPEVGLIDELAHTNAPGMKHEKRWQDVEELRDAGIDVITTVNVQHVESVKDVVERITGIVVRETVPDAVLDRADEIQFIDISPEALRKRMQHGNIYGRDRIDTALTNFFRPGNLAALREIGLRLVAESMARSSGVREAPEDVMVAISGAPSSELLMRRGVRLARRRGGVCMVVLVARPDQRIDVAHYSAVADRLGCSFSVIRGGDVAAEVARAAHEANMSHLVLGESLGREGIGRWKKTLVDRVIDALPDVDIHVVASMEAAPLDDHHRPDPDRLMKRQRTGPRANAHLRVYMGYAAGCGTTTTMLDEARRRQARGTDVVVAAASVQSAAALSGLEVIGGRDGVAPATLDVEAVLARNPEVVAVDDVAGVDADGSRRYQSAARLVAAGITVLGTLHLTDLESVRSRFADVLGHRQQGPPVDDEVLRYAEELELVDVTPATLMERLKNGEIFAPADAARAMQAEFRPQALAALREMAFRVIAEHTDRQLLAYMRERNVAIPWEARVRMVAAIPPRPGMTDRIRRAARMAEALEAQFTVVTVRTRRLSDEHQQALGEYAHLVHQLGGEYVTLYGSNVAEVLANYVRETLSTEVVVGHRLQRWTPWDATSNLIRLLSDVNIHLLRAESGARP
ncbi:MAG TPA: hypothetical protein VG329_05455 [Candidatus Dormibacteraeota bacterium]|jgi:two-component system sensor histidine kinase KdpD|nr:hypothetical protein [Candidatus Dormibacteraeota bacterium]